MKAKHIIVILVLAAISITSCQQPETEPEHQPESISELMDSVLNKGEYIYHNIYCCGDSSYQDSYCLWIDVPDSCAKKKKDLTSYLADKTPKLLDSICKKSEDSYRYCTSDSLDYNIIISKNPHESVSYKQYESKWNNKTSKRFDLLHNIIKKANDSSNDYDAAPIHETLQKFLSEQKKLEKYDVCYEWDEGEPFKNYYDPLYHAYLTRHDQDSLAAFKITGTLYIISAKGQNKIDSLLVELTNRIEMLITKHPIRGVHFRSTTFSSKAQYMVDHISIDNPKKRNIAYTMETIRFPDRLCILELNSEKAPRAAIPVYWWHDIHMHNGVVVYRLPE